ncbi:MAG: hypothetical protein Q9164_007259, partial [Protoblastenia rupestris]
SSSFRFGPFHNTVTEFSIILGNGDIREYSETKNTELFHAAAGSFGALGIVTQLKIKLNKAQNFVKLSYEPVCSIESALKCLDTAQDDSVIDFIGVIMFSKDSGVICSGKLQDDRTDPLQGFVKPGDPYYYCHVRQFAEQQDCLIRQSILLKDYLYRHDRGAFWMGECAFKYFKVPFKDIPEGS